MKCKKLPKNIFKDFQESYYNNFVYSIYTSYLWLFDMQELKIMQEYFLLLYRFHLSEGFFLISVLHFSFSCISALLIWNCKGKKIRLEISMGQQYIGWGQSFQLLFSVSFTLLKLSRTPKNFCLCWFYISTFAILEI